MTSKQAVIGLVASQRQAERIFTALEGAGLSKDDVSMLSLTEPDRAGAAPLRLPVSMVAIPGAGTVIAAGPMLLVLSGELVGAGSRSIAATLNAAGLREHEAKEYESKILRGRVLVAVHVDEHEECALAKAILREGRAADIAVVGGPGASAPPLDAPGWIP